MVSASRRGIALGAAVLILAAPVLFSPGAIGQSANQAAVVVQHGNPTEGGAECVSFTEPQIDGFDLVERSGFEYLAATFDLGRAMCWLDGEGCRTTDPSDCFCDPVSSWSLWVQGEGDSLPAPSETGADDAEVTDATVHYWVWGPVGAAPPIQQTTTDQACPQAAPATAQPSPKPADITARNRGAATRVGPDNRAPLPATR